MHLIIVAAADLLWHIFAVQTLASEMTSLLYSFTLVSCEKDIHFEARKKVTVMLSLLTCLLILFALSSSTLGKIALDHIHLQSCATHINYLTGNNFDSQGYNLDSSTGVYYKIHQRGSPYSLQESLSTCSGENASLYMPKNQDEWDAILDDRRNPSAVSIDRFYIGLHLTTYSVKLTADSLTNGHLQWRDGTAFTG